MKHSSAVRNSKLKQSNVWSACDAFTHLSRAFFSHSLNVGAMFSLQQTSALVHCALWFSQLGLLPNITLTKLLLFLHIWPLMQKQSRTVIMAKKKKKYKTPTVATLCCQGRAEGLGWGLSAHSKNPLSPMPTPKKKKQEGGSNYVKKRKEKRKRTAKNK